MAVLRSPRVRHPQAGGFVAQSPDRTLAFAARSLNERASGDRDCELRAGVCSRIAHTVAADMRAMIA